MPATTSRKRSSRPLPREVLTPAQVEQITGLSKNTLYALLSSGKVPGLRAGRRWLIPRESLDRWLSTADQGPARV